MLRTSSKLANQRGINFSLLIAGPDDCGSRLLYGDTGPLGLRTCRLRRQSVPTRSNVQGIQQALSNVLLRGHTSTCLRTDSVASPSERICAEIRAEKSLAWPCHVLGLSAGPERVGAPEKSCRPRR